MHIIRNVLLYAKLTICQSLKYFCCLNKGDCQPSIEFLIHNWKCMIVVCCGINFVYPGSQSFSGLGLWFLSLHQMTPLHVAAKSDRYKILEYLVDRGADISTKDSDGVSICEYTCE